MGNQISQPQGLQDEAARARQQQLQELQDISSDYLDQLQSIIESRAEMDPRDVMAILKSNLKTAKEQIEKMSSRVQRYANHDSPIPNGNNNNHSPITNNKLQLAPTDSDSTNASSFFTKFGPLHGRIAYGMLPSLFCFIYLTHFKNITFQNQTCINGTI